MPFIINPAMDQPTDPWIWVTRTYPRKDGFACQSRNEGIFWRPGIQSGIGFALLCGIDPDDPEAAGYHGDGVSCVTDEDFERMLHDLDLTKTNVVLINADTLPIFAHFIAYADQKGVPRNKLRGNTMNWQFTAWWLPSMLWEPEGGLKLATDLIQFCSREMPDWNHTNFECHAFSEMGANAVQQMAFGIATAIAVADSCVKAGMEPDAFMPGWDSKSQIAMIF
jgi:methylmalonyl-CoA mutase N-terminal domain/subunit